MGVAPVPCLWSITSLSRGCQADTPVTRVGQADQFDDPEDKAAYVAEQVAEFKREVWAPAPCDLRSETTVLD